MAFTREFIRNAARESGVEIPKELENALVDEHISTRDAFAAEQVKTALENNKPEPDVAVKDTQEYKDLKKRFDDYKADIAAKETHGKKYNAVRALMKEVGISEKRLDAILKIYDVDAVELDDKDAVKDPETLSESIKAEFEDFIERVETRGADVPHPPTNTGGTAMTKEQIMGIKDAGERQKAIAENPSLFGLKFD